MNNKQRIVVVIGTILVISSGLFVPYEGEFVYQKETSLRRYMGYGLFFSPPSGKEVYQAIFSRSPENTKVSPIPHCNAHIITSRVWVQLAIIGFVTFATFLLLGTKKGEVSSSKPDIDDGL